MVIEINGKEYELKFGFNFLKTISRREEFQMKIEVVQAGHDAKVNTGLKRLQTGVNKLQAFDVMTVVATIHSALSHKNHNLEEEDIFEYINSLIDVDNNDTSDYKDLVNELLVNIKKVPTALVELAG